MKEIKDMTLTECIDRLRELPDGTCQDQFDMRDLPWIWDVAEELANRIDTLLFEQAQRHDAWVDALESRINSLEAERRWIPVSERLPNHLSDYVYVYYDGMVATMLYSIDKGFHGSTPNRMEMFAHEITHWKRITSPEDKP
jgi:hypothetical protein